MSLVESIANTGAGFLVSLVLQLSLFSLMAIETTATQNLTMSGVFTLASLVRGYLMRRVFIWWESPKYTLVPDRFHAGEEVAGH